MNRVLVLDSRGGHQRSLATRLIECAPSEIEYVDRVGGSTPAELVVMDYGDAASELAVRDALRYRTENPRCRVAVIRVLDPSWPEVECRARLDSLPSADRAQTQIGAAAVRRMMCAEPQFDLRIDNDAVLFEYAA